jgi:uncharacterized protein
MPRPVKPRRVENYPSESYFAPRGSRIDEVEEVALKVEELEAMRLKDIEELSQEECAGRMNVSRQTFQNIIDSARKKTATALTEGKAISIGGGNYAHKSCRFKCMDCSEEYDLYAARDPGKCPACSSDNVVCNKRHDGCGKWCGLKAESTGHGMAND